MTAGYHEVLYDDGDQYKGEWNSDGKVQKEQVNIYLSIYIYKYIAIHLHIIITIARSSNTHIVSLPHLFVVYVCICYAWCVHVR